MNRFMAGVKRFVREEEGTEVVEWALVAGLVVAVGAVVFTAIGTKAEELLNELLTVMGGGTDTAN
jgi:pilus assembly protein Flp/PilA